MRNLLLMAMMKSGSLDHQYWTQQHCYGRE